MNTNNSSTSSVKSQGSGMRAALAVFADAEARCVPLTEPMYAALIRGFGQAYELESALGVSRELCCISAYVTCDL